MNNEEYFFVVCVVTVVLVLIYVILSTKRKKAYRRAVPVPQSLLLLGVEKRCYPDPHNVTFFVGGRSVGKATSRLVQKDMDQLVARGYRMVQSYRNHQGGVVNVTPEAMFELKVRLKQMGQYTQGRPERHPDFQKVFPYAYISITVV